MDTILDTRRVELPKPALELHRSQFDVAIALLWRFSLSPSLDHGSFSQPSISWNRIDHVTTSRTPTACPSQFGWSTLAALTIISLICSTAEREDYETGVPFFDVLWLYGTSSSSNSNTLPSWYAYALMFLSLHEEDIVSHVVHFWKRHRHRSSGHIRKFSFRTRD